MGWQPERGSVDGLVVDTAQHWVTTASRWVTAEGDYGVTRGHTLARSAINSVLQDRTSMVADLTQARVASEASEAGLSLELTLDEYERQLDVARQRLKSIFDRQLLEHRTI